MSPSELSAKGDNISDRGMCSITGSLSVAAENQNK